MRRAALLIGLLLAAAPATLSAEDALRPVRVAFHVHTGVSDGIWTAAQVIQEAERVGLDAVVIADSLIERWEFGLPPWRRVVRRTHRESSVLTWGAEQYLQYLRDVAESSRVIVVPGVTVSPHYRWTDIPLLRGGRLEGWHRQLIVLGLNDPAVLRNMPATSNSAGSWSRVWRTPWRLWPLLFMIGGLALWRRRPRAAALGVSLTVIGVLAGLNIEPGRTSVFDPYGRDPGAAPFQQTINYVRAHGGLAIWSHPELISRGRFLGIPVDTDGHAHLVAATHGALGFGANYWSEVTMVAPGAGWDQLLQAYCAGRREQPTWLFGEIAWHNTDRPLNMVETVAFVADRTPVALLDALQDGRMYAQFNLHAGRDVELTAYRVVDEGTAQQAGLGDTLAQTGPVRVELAGVQRVSAKPTTLQILRNGAVAHEELLETPAFTVAWRDDTPPEALGYYRVALTHGSSAIYTNPTFVRRHVP